MNQIDKIVGGMFALIGLYLVLRYSSQAGQVIASGGSFIATQTSVLQGNPYMGGIVGGNPARNASYTGPNPIYSL